MNSEIAKVTLELLNRVDLKGGEVPAFNAIVASLVSIVEAEKVEESEE